MQVTLQILQALIDKSPRDLPLYAPYVMRILGIALRSNDLTMVEDSIPTFQTFCIHHDIATLAADQEHVRQYEDLVKMYTSFATQIPPGQSKGTLAAPIAIRWRSVGLQAIRSITTTEALSADGGKQINMVVQQILQNLHPENEDILLVLQERAQIDEKGDKELGLTRKLSASTVQTNDTNPNINAAAVSGTTADADRLAEEEVGLLALLSLKQIFEANNRNQIRLATAAILRFVTGKSTKHRSNNEKPTGSEVEDSWTTRVMEMVARWTPVQDRFIILVTAMEMLIRSPIAEENLAQQRIIVASVGWLLGSSINMIGLSVMDVLLGLIQHILLLLQLGGKGSNVLPHHQQTDAIDLFKERKSSQDESLPLDRTEKSGVQDASSPSAMRQDLLIRLQRCIGDLATHIYYSDQISDMISAILLRLKPSPLSGIKSAAAAIERPAAAAQAISDSVNLQEDPKTDDFFSFGTARITALNAIREVLTIANMKGSVSGAGAIGRNKVTVQVWEGTQWLLRDEDRRVRQAYVDALVTWLRLEMGKDDLRVHEELRHSSRNNGKASGNSERGISQTRRAVSSASQRSRSTQPHSSSFLQLLHLAIYDNVLESPESVYDILLLHLLLTQLVDKLGVHAVRSGLPMIMRLQEDIDVDDIFSTPIAKTNVGSLVHGYLLTVSRKFDFDSTAVAYEIQKEVSRRKSHGLWVEGVQIPSLTLEQIRATSYSSNRKNSSLPASTNESLVPFDARPALVNQIALSYNSSVASPPSSPPGSPGRVFSMPILSAPISVPSSRSELPAKFKEAMLTNWTKESCIAAAEKESSRAASVTGSRTNRSIRNNYLTIDSHYHGNGSPVGADTPPEFNLLKPHGVDAQSPDALSPTMSPLQQQFRRLSGQDNGSPTPNSNSDQQPTLRVEDLKRALAGGVLVAAPAGTFSHRSSSSAVRSASPLRNTNTAYQDFGNTSRERSGLVNSSPDSDSDVEAEGYESASEGDLGNRPLPPTQPQLGSSELAAEYFEEVGKPSFEHSPSPARIHSRTHSRDGSRARPRTASSASEDPEAVARALKGELVSPSSLNSGKDHVEDIPPVPPLPPSVSILGGSLGKRTPRHSLQNSLEKAPVLTDGPAKLSAKTLSAEAKRSSGAESMASSSRESRKSMGIRNFLGDIPVGDGGPRKSISKPPY